MHDAFFTEELDRGLLFHVRRTNLMRDNRTNHIVDEIEEAIKKQRAEDEREGKRDMSYEEFVSKYQDHIEGKASSEDRFANRPGTAEGADDNPKATIMSNQTEEHKGDENATDRAK